MTLLTQLYPRASDAHLSAVAGQATDVLGRFDLLARDIRVHFLLAQIGHETAGLTLLEEGLSYSAEGIVKTWPKRFSSPAEAAPFARNPEKLANQVYAGRMGNGAPASGDGFRFRGRGYIQLTGRDAYRAVGEIAGLQLEASPDLAIDPQHALTVVAAFWQWKNLNPVCDTGDFDAVSRKISGGAIGAADRRHWLDKVRRAFAAPVPADQQPAANLVVAVQRALRAKRYVEVGAADGQIGPRTLAAITRFRAANGLPAGVIDDALLRALDVEV
ncbi:MAG: peptidoglycan-binding protein [Alphaproteobacteria bacterium]|nr:peptidoglycan-binding protein [Alphaproteobacteria bacterium]